MLLTAYKLTHGSQIPTKRQRFPRQYFRNIWKHLVEFAHYSRSLHLARLRS